MGPGLNLANGAVMRQSMAERRSRRQFSLARTKSQRDNRRTTWKGEVRMQKRPAGFSWSQWDASERVVFVCCCIAAASFLLPWVDVGFASRHGLANTPLLVF